MNEERPVSRKEETCGSLRAALCTEKIIMHTSRRVKERVGVREDVGHNAYCLYIMCGCAYVCVCVCST